MVRCEAAPHTCVTEASPPLGHLQATSRPPLGPFQALPVPVPGLQWAGAWSVPGLESGMTLDEDKGTRGEEGWGEEEVERMGMAVGRAKLESLFSR